MQRLAVAAIVGLLAACGSSRVKAEPAPPPPPPPPLPAAAPAPLAADPELIAEQKVIQAVITVMPNAVTMIDGRPVTVDELDSHLRRRAALDRRSPLAVTVLGPVNAASIAAVMDRLARHGLDRCAVVRRNP